MRDQYLGHSYLILPTYRSQLSIFKDIPYTLDVPHTKFGQPRINGTEEFSLYCRLCQNVHFSNLLTVLNA